MADKEVDGRGDVDKEVDGRGEVDKEVDGRGGPNGSAGLIGDIVSRATALGGWLVVSFVAPLPPSGVSTVRREDATAAFRKGFSAKAEANAAARTTGAGRYARRTTGAGRYARKRTRPTK